MKILHKGRRKSIFSVLLIFSFLFSFFLAAAEKEPLFTKLEKHIPANGDLVIFFDLALQQDAKEKASIDLGIFYKKILATVPADTTKKFSTTLEKLFSKRLFAIFCGSGKNDMVIFHTAVSNEEFLTHIKGIAENIRQQKDGKIHYYTGNFPGKMDKGFLFTFPEKNIVIFTENTFQQKENLFRALNEKKEAAQWVKNILIKKRKEAMIYGAVREECMETFSGGLFPEAKNVRSAGFDVSITKDNTLSIHIFIGTSNRETAQSLVMLLNNYKMLLVGLLAGNMDLSGTGKNNGMDQPFDPSSLVKIRLKGNDIQIVLDLPPALLPVLQGMFLLDGSSKI